MYESESCLATLENKSCSITLDLDGGAIIDFHNKSNNVNPLSFSFSREQMPENNKSGACYKGHFLCCGRWGRPSDGEIKSGLPDHGHIANILWNLVGNAEAGALRMQASSNLEGLNIDRTVVIDNEYPLVTVKELVTNINPLGRLYNMVQHPTLAAPFLDGKVIIDCNADIGFDQFKHREAFENKISWKGCRDNFVINNPLHEADLITSFIVNPSHKYGWVTVFSPTHDLLFGYIWNRTHYPWLHFWQNFEDNKIKFLGLEFGTGGIHQPFNEILNSATHLFGQKTFGYIDSGETVIKKYASFLFNTKQDFKGIEAIDVSGHSLNIYTKGINAVITLKLNSSIYHEFFE